MATFDSTAWVDPPLVPGNASSIERVTPAQDYTLSTTADTIRLFRLPTGAKLLGGAVQLEALDSDGAPTGEISLIVTDGTTTKVVLGPLAAETAGFFDARSATTPSTEFFSFVIPDNTWRAEIRVDTNMATAAAGNIQASVEYTRALESGEAPSRG